MQIEFFLIILDWKEEHREVSEKSWFHDLDLDREFSVFILRVISGHLTTKKELHRMGWVEIFLCNCYEVEVMNRLLFGCVLYKN